MWVTWCIYDKWLTDMMDYEEKKPFDGAICILLLTTNQCYSKLSVSICKLIKATNWFPTSKQSHSDSGQS